MNPLEKSADAAVKSVKGRTPFTSQEHAQAALGLANLEADLKLDYATLQERGYKKSAGYLKAALDAVRKARAEQNSCFLRERRSENESPYYGGKTKPTGTEEGATIPAAPEDTDHGHETD